MGSKNIKAIAVRGSVSLGLENKSLMQQLMRWITGNYKDLMGWAVEAGTSGSVQFLHDIGSTPIHNFQDGVFENIDKLDANHFFDFLLVGRDTCNHCPVRCKIVVENRDDNLEISRNYGGPEYESIGALGPMCMISDPVVVAKANSMCAAYGLDTISTGGTIAFTMECVEKGILAPNQDYSFLPVFGNHQDLLQSVRCIAYKEGIGKLMAEGSARMAEIIGNGSEKFVVTTRGQEFPLHDPRFRNATGLGYALSPTGADHMHNMNDYHANNPLTDTCARLREVGITTPLPLFGLPEEKVRAFSYELAFKHFSDSAVFCQFYPYEYHHMMEAMKAATGWEMTIDEIVDIGKRIATMSRLFLLREGFTAKDDKLPPRMMEAHDDGPIAGKIVTEKVIHQAVHDHYKFMNWDVNGVPNQDEIDRLSLNWIVV
jgi:aldehyde:ferredoxin oxidoreductase